MLKRKVSSLNEVERLTEVLDKQISQYEKMVMLGLPSKNQTLIIERTKNTLLKLGVKK